MSVFILPLALSPFQVLSMDNSVSKACVTRKTEAGSCWRTPACLDYDIRLSGSPKNPQENPHPHSVEDDVEAQ